nr:unnamed protein product [Digitaria exilis]
MVALCAPFGLTTCVLPCCRRSSSREQSPRLHTPSSLQGPPTLQSPQQQQRRRLQQPTSGADKGETRSGWGCLGIGKRRIWIWAAERGAPFWVAVVVACCGVVVRDGNLPEAAAQEGATTTALRCGALHLCGTPHERAWVAVAEQAGTRHRWNSKRRNGFGKARVGRMEFAHLPAVRLSGGGAEEEEVVARRARRPDPSAPYSEPSPRSTEHAIGFLELHWCSRTPRTSANDPELTGVEAAAAAPPPPRRRRNSDHPRPPNRPQTTRGEPRILFPHFPEPSSPPFGRRNSGESRGPFFIVFVCLGSEITSSALTVIHGCEQKKRHAKLGNKDKGAPGTKGQKAQEGSGRDNRRRNGPATTVGSVAGSVHVSMAWNTVCTGVMASRKNYRGVD